MTNLYLWAQTWGVPPEAIQDLCGRLGVATDPEAHTAYTPEAQVQNLVRMEASKKGLRLWRNNVGACQDENGRHIRYGLANDSKKLNTAVKSSDLIGIRPVRVGEEMVGGVIGQFVAREVKAGSWKYSGTEREQAQLAFLNLVLSLGGDASFANCEGTL